MSGRTGRPVSVAAALAADPALIGRVTCDGNVVVIGPNGGPCPTSLKERERWELHVRLRVQAELGPVVAAGIMVRWADANA
jgi:hypothetical protein